MYTAIEPEGKWGGCRAVPGRKIPEAIYELNIVVCVATGKVLTNKMLLVDVRSPYPDAVNTPGVVSDSFPISTRQYLFQK